MNIDISIDINSKKDWTLPVSVPINANTPRCSTFEGVVVNKLEDANQQ